MIPPAPSFLRPLPTARPLLAAFATLTLAVACGGIAVVDVDAGAGGAAASTSSSASGTGTTNVTASSSSGGGVSCGALAQQYVATVDALKTCDEDGDPSQCSLFVNDALACPCLTSINVNGPGPQLLDNLLAEWEAANCGDDIECPAIACLDIQGTGCFDGKCTDFGPD